jgi:hypothetical protein
LSLKDKLSNDLMTCTKKVKAQDQSLATLDNRLHILVHSSTQAHPLKGAPTFQLHCPALRSPTSSGVKGTKESPSSTFGNPTCHLLSPSSSPASPPPQAAQTLQPPGLAH